MGTGINPMEEVCYVYPESLFGHSRLVRVAWRLIVFRIGYDGGAYSENGVGSNLQMGVFGVNFIKIHSDKHIFFFFCINVLDYALFGEVIPSPFFVSDFFNMFWL